MIMYLKLYINNLPSNFDYSLSLIQYHRLKHICESSQENSLLLISVMFIL